jgi:lipoate-protein ligase A
MRQVTFRTDLPKSGLENMAVDSDCLQEAEKSDSPLTVIRFYQWLHPTVSLGKHQTAERACGVDFCRENSIPVVHRPTGGRAVLHDNELTYSVVSNDPVLFPLNDLMATYHLVSRALQKGFQVFGIPVVASAGTRENPMSRKDQQQSPCFSSPTRHELMARGRKLAGSAQRRLKRSFLQHGSIPLHVDYEFMAGALATTPEILAAQMIGVDEMVSRTYQLDELINCMQAGFREILEPHCR